MTNEEKLIKNKLTMLELADYLDNVSKACKITGYSRDIVNPKIPFVYTR